MPGRVMKMEMSHFELSGSFGFAVMIIKEIVEIRIRAICV